MNRIVRALARFVLAVVIIILVGMGVIYALTGDTANLPVAAGTGPSPLLPEPHPPLFPTVKIASVVGWPENASPTAAAGLKVTAFIRGLEHPRWLYVLPNGDVLAAESDSPHFPADARGIRGQVARWMMAKAGAGGASPDRIILLRQGANGTQRFNLATGLTSPFGMALVSNDLYIADTDALLRFTYHDGDTSLTGPGTKVTDLPGGPIDHHWTKNVIASPDGTKLYVSVGSNSNVGENGMAAEEGRAAIWEIDRATGAHRIFAYGLRNPVGLAFEPTSGALWTTVNERDELGSDLVPDYMTHVTDGAFYGWPYSYYGQHVDARPQPPRPDLVAKAIPPDYALGSHVAALGLCFSHSGALPEQFTQGAFVGEHGSWNRNPPSGYRVVFIPFKDGKPAGAPTDVLTGFLNGQDQALGRPVGVALDREGALLVADDVGGVVWKVTASP